MVANLKRFQRTPVTIRVGEVYTLVSLPKENREGTIQDYNDEIMCRIAALLPEEYRGVYADHPRVDELTS
jgi:1-acyl-sn-glycerol-3-phosphate acyltransferase